VVDHRRARELVRAYHLELEPIDEEQLDEALGLTEHRQVVHSSYEPALENRFADESVVYLPTPYPLCRTFFHAVALGKQDLVIDLGSGVGRFLLYGALISDARFRGIELIAQRSATAARCVSALQLNQIDVVEGNVLEQDLSDATVFYFYRPFSAQTEATVVGRIHQLATQKPLTVGACRLLPTLFNPEIFERSDLGSLQVYRSAIRSRSDRSGGDQ